MFVTLKSSLYVNNSACVHRKQREQRASGALSREGHAHSGLQGVRASVVGALPAKPGRAWKEPKGHDLTRGCEPEKGTAGGPGGQGEGEGESRNHICVF